MITIYHNPACSKSRAALELLQARNPALQIVRYLDTPPDAALLKLLLTQLQMKPAELIRKGESAAATLDLLNMDDDELISAMIAEPTLIERPIVVNGDRAVIGRPPERVLEIL